jgi:hypothetical protein
VKALWWHKHSLCAPSHAFLWPPVRHSGCSTCCCLCYSVGSLVGLLSKALVAAAYGSANLQLCCERCIALVPLSELGPGTVRMPGR